MPRKIRQLIADLEEHGFVDRGGEGSHRNFLHPSGVKMTLSGAAGDDAKHYQERDLKRVIKKDQSMKKPSDRYLKLVAWSVPPFSRAIRCPPAVAGNPRLRSAVRGWRSVLSDFLRVRQWPLHQSASSA